MRDSKIFDEAIAKCFQPIAQDLGLPLSKVSDGVYEISSPYFILRMRLHTGHRRGFNVMLRQTSFREFDENEPFVQYGVGCFMEFHGEDLKQTFIDIDTDDDFIRQGQLLADATKRYGVAYLEGQGKDFDAVQEIVKKQAQESIEEIKKYRLPKNVRKEWI
ncbi:MAG TPA: hypothetical protein VMA13_03850 [Candidatus Saccharimonadales bacterium]|nr:hypothetical protein [Candidatus Saccharimonadales bacterium]